MAEWYEGDVVANGVRLHYHRTGGTKPALVIAHGLTDTGMIWSRVARALEQDYDVVIYDRRGHGLSDKPGNGLHLASSRGRPGGPDRRPGLATSEGHRSLGGRGRGDARCRKPVGPHGMPDP